MKLNLNNREYEFLTASDIERNGVGLEVWDTETNQLILEIFRNDSLKKIEFYSEKENYSLELIEKAIELFNEKVGRKFQV